jgi:hypothetical protein
MNYKHISESGPEDVYCGRGPDSAVRAPGKKGWLGNPIKKGQTCPVCSETHRKDGSTLECYRQYLRRRVRTSEPFIQGLKDVYYRTREGAALVCFCHDPARCHTSVLEEAILALADHFGW